MKNWSEVDDATVRKHFHDEEKSYSQIAALYDDATIGKVASRCRRLGLKRGTSHFLGTKRPGRGAIAAPEPAPKPVPTPKPREKRAKPQRAEVSIVAMRHENQKRSFARGEVPLEHLETSSCRWPHGDPRTKEFGFCGEHREGEGPYCAEHNKVAYNRQPLGTVRRRA